MLVVLVGVVVKSAWQLTQRLLVQYVCPLAALPTACASDISIMPSNSDAVKPNTDLIFIFPDERDFVRKISTRDKTFFKTPLTALNLKSISPPLGKESRSCYRPLWSAINN
jgi:hypothetical protein